MKKAKLLFKENKSLLSFMALSYLDKAVIFLLPLLVLQLFKDQRGYVTIEYIYSATTVIIPLIDLGLSGYFYYAYRNSKNKDKTVLDFERAFQRIYLIVSVLCLIIIAINFLGFEFEKFIVFIVSRLLFVLATTFFASYYRLINKPERVIYITLASNIFSLLFLFGFFFFSTEFALWLVFIGQIIFSIYYFLKSIVIVFVKAKEQFDFRQLKKIIKGSILFSWPSIIQVFIMMYIANYGKLQALDNMSLDDGTLLSFTQRFSMLIQLTHASVLAYLVKEIYVAKNKLAIQKSVLFKYLLLLTVSTICVLVLIIGYIFYIDINYDTNRVILLISCVVSYTFIWCVSSFFEVYYSRENKNELKLFLALVHGISFIIIFNIVNLDFLQKIVIAMFTSVLISFLSSLLILKKRKYYLN